MAGAVATPTCPLVGRHTSLRVSDTLTGNCPLAPSWAVLSTSGDLAITAHTHGSHHVPNPTTATTDILIVGAGIAGLSFALSLPFPARVMLATKGALGESNTRYAQGGLAAAISESDDAELHLRDTIDAGAGLVDVDAARMLVGAGKESVDWLIEHGTKFDYEDGQIALGKEGAHSRSRVLHAGGDATGAEIERALVNQIAARHDLTVFEHATVLDLRMHDGRCVGAALSLGPTDHRMTVASAVTVFALGGAGQLWAVTSNPAGATGDGIAIAYRAGATLADLEFTQFHPTVLDIPGKEPFLISEAVRGEGAYLRNDDGERFMLAIDHRAELAPRDVVARAIQDQFARGSKAWLDLRQLDANSVRLRFPTIDRHLRAIGLDFAADLIPVAPAAHYFMGGIAAAPDGRTSVPGLLAIGEVSCTGVHGANRLASNSLLEGLVFGCIAAKSLTPSHLDPDVPAPSEPSHPTSPDIDAAELLTVRQRIQDIMRTHVSVVRWHSSLTTALDELEAMKQSRALHQETVAGHEVQNMWLLAREITRSALNREESRGGHFRSDFPSANPSLEGQHQLVVPTRTDGSQRTFGTVDRAWATAGKESLAHRVT